MDKDELFVFKCYDSRQNAGGFTPHCSFADPDTADDAAERESIELRALVFWEHEAAQEVARHH